MSIMTNKKKLYVCPCYDDLPEDILLVCNDLVVCAYNGRTCSALSLQQQYEFLLRSCVIVNSNKKKFKVAPIRVRVATMFQVYTKGDMKKSGIPLLVKAKSITKVASCSTFLTYRLNNNLMDMLYANKDT